MRTALKVVIVAMLALLAPLLARANENAQGWCEDGAQVVVTSGLNSTTQVQASYPQCTITVFVHGGGLATIYADNATTPTPLANPFIATTNGQWLFYAANGRYDVTMSGAGFPQTVTYSDILLCDPAGGGGCGGGGGGGTVTGTGTLNYVTEWYSTTSIGNASGYDDRVHPVQWPNGVSIMSNGLYLLLPNANPGTVVSNTVCRNPSNQAITCAAGAVNGLVGSAQQGAGNGGSVQVCYTGSCLFVFDNQTVPGDWAILSATTAGSLHDVGSAIETPGYQNVLVTTANAGPATTAAVAILTPDEIGVAGKTGPLPNPYGVTPITNSYTVQASDASHQVDITGTAAAQTVTLPQPSTNGTPTYVQSTANTSSCFSVTTCTTPTLTVNAGDSLIFTIVGLTTTGIPNTPTDSAGDVFVPIGTTLVPQTNYVMQTYWTRATAGGASLTVTGTLTSAATEIDIFLGDFANLTAFDQFGGTVGGINQGILSPQITTTQPVEVLVASVEQACGAPNNPAAGFISVQNGTGTSFMYQQVPVVGNYVGGLAATCNASAHWAASVASFVVNGSAPQFTNGFWIWIANHSNQTWTIAAEGGADIISCAGTSATSTTLAASTGVWFESDGVNWRTACGQGGGGGGSGTVTSIATTAPITGGTITTSGTLACPTCATAASALTVNQVLIGGAGQAITPLGTTGSTGTFLEGNAFGAPSFAAVPAGSLTGILPIANGGTGAATANAHLWFGNNTGGTLAPDFESIGVADLPFTYTTTNGATLLLTGSGSFTNGHCVAVGANGNMVDNGSACGTGGGGGTVTSVGLALPSIFTVSGSPVTTTGTLTGALASQAANIVFAGPVSGTAAPTFRALVGADLPNPGLTTLGGVEAKNAFAHQWINSISASGVPLTSQPAFTDISGTLGPAQGPLTTEGDLWYFHSSANARLAVGTAGQCLTSNGTDPLWSACTPGTGITLSTNGTNNATQTVLNLVNSAATFGETLTVTNTSGGTVQLGQTGTRTIAGGGTGQTTANAAFNALSPMTTEGDVIYLHSGVATRLPLGANGSCLQSNGTDPVYGSCATGTITGGGTTNAFALFSSATSIASAPLTLSGTTITTTDTVAVGSLTVGSGAGTLQISNTVTGKVNPIAFSTSPAINLSLGNVQQFACTTGGSAVVAGTPSALVAGMQLTFIIVQNASTACTWAWPSNVHGGGTISATLSSVNTQSFVVSNNGTDLYAASGMVTSTGGTP